MIPSKETLDIVINMTPQATYTLQFQHRGMPMGEDQHYDNGKDVARCIRGVTEAFPNYAIISKSRALYDIVMPLIQYED